MVEDAARRGGGSANKAVKVKSEGGTSRPRKMTSGSPREHKGAEGKKKSQQGGGGGGSGGDAKRIKSEGDEEAVPKEKRKAGQKFKTLSPGQPDRVFYETLLKQNPNSHMAQDWCLAYGVCPAAEAEALYKLVCKRKALQPTSGAPPLSSSPTKKAKTPSSSGGKSRPRSSLPKEADTDTGFEASGVFEGVGTTGF